MIYKDRTYRKTEEISASNPTLEGRLSALENFGGGKSVVDEIREELGAPEPVVSEVAETAPVSDSTTINASLEGGLDATAEETLSTEASVTEPAASESTGLKIESNIFENGALDLGGEKPEAKNYSEDVNSFVTEFGFESASDFESKLKEYRETSAQVGELKDKVENNDKLFAQMPKDMYNSVVAFFNNEEDWRKHVSDKGIDYTQDFNSISKEEILNTFFPNEFSADDWEEYNDEDGDTNVKKAIDIALRNASGEFESKKNEIMSYQSEVSNRQAKSMESIGNSINNTLKNLPSQMQGLSESYVKSIESKIRNNEILSLFYEQDGTLKPDAAHRLILAQDGSNLLEQYSNLYKVQAKNEATQEILDRSSDAPNKTQGGSSTASGAGKSAVQQNIDRMTETFVKKQTF